jgi:Ca2+-binding RTX toxin-like protein
MTDAHIHGAEVGATGPIIFDFLEDAETDVNPSAGRITGGWDANEAAAFDMTPTNLADLLAGDTYFNIHTNRDPSGFIRGQILRDGSAADRIDLTELNIGSFSTLAAITSNRGGDALIRTFLAGEESALRLDGIAKADLRQRHFVLAGDEAETIAGTSSRDDLFGAGAADRLNGRGGDDRMFGEDGADTLLGRSGRDALVGGLDRDLMAGGAAADRFVFSDVDETGASARTADRITDFVAGLDLLVLAGIDAREGRPGNQAFSFIGDQDFNRAGQVRVTEVGGNTIVELNTAGSDDAEAMIRLRGSIVLTEDSLVL